MLAAFTVDSLLDNFDPNTPTTDGLISLREAILAANSNAAVGDALAGSGADTIDFSVTGTINLTFGELGVTDSLTINGPGANQLTINAGGSSRIFNIDDGFSFTNDVVAISGLTLTGGNATGGGGAIRSREVLTLSDLVVTGNTASGNGGGIDAGSGIATSIVDTIVSNNSTTGNDAEGGGISVITYGGSTTTISGSTISGNETSGTNAEGAGIFVLNFATTNISLSTISGNSTSGMSSSGGGLYVDTKSTGVTTISQSTISGNSTDETGHGGGIYLATDSGGMTTITDSTVSGNSTNSTSSNADGGGIFVSDQGTTTVTNSTISGNTSRGDGGGIAISTSSGNTTIEHTTIAFNTTFPSFFTGKGGGGLFISSGSLTLDHSIVAANTDSSDTAPDISGTVAVTFSLIGDGKGATITDNGGNQIGSSGGDLSVSIDMAAMGDFESGGIGNDSYVFEYSLNGGGFLPLFTSSVDEAGSLIYTFEDGSTQTDDDPLQVNGTTLANQFQTLTAVVPGSAAGDSLELRLTATSDGAFDVFAFRNITVQLATGNGVIGRALGPEPDLNVAFVQDDPDYTISGDMFGIRSRTNPGTPGLPDDIVDDTVASPPDIQGGIIRSTDMADFFGIVDTVNATGNDVNVARWTFAIDVIDPLLGLLQFNGGPTQTHALSPSSPAIDAGDPAIASPPASDQRGNPFVRVFDDPSVSGTAIDLGAYERQTVVGLNLTVDTLVDEFDGDYSTGDLSLREAVNLANANLGPDTILFDASLNGGTILLQDGLGEIDITDYVKLDASSLPLGITVDAGNGTDNTFGTGDGFRIFNIGLITETVVQIGDDFETDTSSDYTVVDDGTPDGTATFAFDYVAAGIPLAPNSSVGDSGGLRLTANDTAGVTDAITAFLNTPIDSNDARLTVDIFLNVGGISGTTEYAHVGMAGDGATFNSVFTPISGSGTFLAFNGDGDSVSSDYRWFVESTTTTPTTDPSYLAGSGANTAQLYQDIYPATNGSPKNIWTTLEIIFDGDRIVYRLDGIAIIDSSFSDPLQVTNTLTSPSGLVSLGYADVFTSIANPFQSQFVVYDNLQVEYVVPQSVELVGLTLTGGDAAAGDSFGRGGAINTLDRLTITDSSIIGNAAALAGGGITTSLRGDLTVIDSSISGNSAVLSNGGGIYSIRNNVTATGSTFNGNSADGYGGGISGRQSKITVTSSTVSGNSAGRGGGIASRFTGSDLTVTDSTIADNSATDSFSSGGGLLSSLGNLTVTGSTISGNSANFSGGGISSSTDLAGLTTTIVNSTFSGNTADFDNDGLGEGGGIRNITGLMVIEHSTITGNTAAAGRGSGILSRGNTYTLTEISHTIIAGNTNSDVDFFVSNSFQSFGSNLIGTGNALANFAATGDQTGVTNPMLGLLANNGAPTFTHALLPGSPAIDAGDPAAMAGGGAVPLFDQRGNSFGRVQNGRIDIGAFEVRDTPSADFDSDGFITGFDFLLWQIGLGTPAPGAIKTDGDADNDLDADSSDLDVWELQYGTAAPVVAAATASIFTESFSTEPVAQSSLASSDLVDVALAVALEEEADWVFGKREFVAHSPPLKFFSAELFGRSDRRPASSFSSPANTSATSTQESGSLDGPSPWEDAVDEVFASVFK